MAFSLFRGTFDGMGLRGGAVTPPVWVPEHDGLRASIGGVPITFVCVSRDPDGTELRLFEKLRQTVSGDNIGFAHKTSVHQMSMMSVCACTMVPIVSCMQVHANDLFVFGGSSRGRAILRHRDPALWPTGDFWGGPWNQVILLPMYLHQYQVELAATRIERLLR